MRGFYVGRFQPLHYGHIAVIKRIIHEVDQLIIGIGSAQFSFTKDNPFTTGERIEMIDSCLKAEGVDPGRYIMIPINDVGIYGTWVAHVESHCPKFDIVYTGSNITKMLFEATRNYKVRKIKRIPKFSATLVRRRLMQDNGWEELVHPAAAKFLKRIKAGKRLREINGTG